MMTNKMHIDRNAASHRPRATRAATHNFSPEPSEWTAHTKLLFSILFFAHCQHAVVAHSLFRWFVHFNFDRRHRFGGESIRFAAVCGRGCVLCVCFKFPSSFVRRLYSIFFLQVVFFSVAGNSTIDARYEQTQRVVYARELVKYAYAIRFHEHLTASPPQSPQPQNTATKKNLK